MSRPKAFAVRVGEYLAICGYRGDGVVRVLKVESFDETHVTGVDLLRSSPTAPTVRTYLVEHVDRFAPVIGQEAE